MADEEINEEQDSDQFNSMLNAAKKQVGAENAASSKSLTPEQLEQIMGLADDEDDKDKDDSADGSTGSEQEGGEAKEGNGEEGAAEGEGESPEEGGKKKKKKAPKPKKEKKPINKVLLKRIGVVAAVVLAAAAGFAVPIFMYNDVIKSDTEKFAIMAANAVNSRIQANQINTELYIYKCYVNKGAAAEECMLYGLTSYGGSDKLDIYRVVVENDAPDTINIYYTIDTSGSGYSNMRGGNDEDSIKAAQLLYHYENTLEADREIKEGSEKWERVDCAIINRNIKAV